MTAAVFLGAYIIDIIIGDPRWFPHSVVNIGKAVRFLEGKIRPVYGIAFSTFYQYIK
jgi:adenosylcobinamide-phosphate synthase